MSEINPYIEFTDQNLEYAKAFMARLIAKSLQADWVGRLFETYGMIVFEQEQRET